MVRETLDNCRAVLFDLDGTLLEVQMERFIPAYLGELSRLFSDLVEPERFRNGVRAVILSLLQPREAELTNADYFLHEVERNLGIPGERFRRSFSAWAETGLERLKPLVEPLPLAADLVAAAGGAGREVVIATNPVFPRAVIEARLAWGGLADCHFRHVTWAENSRSCKPNSSYFAHLLELLGLPAEACLMVGNDTGHDLAAAELGISTWLVETWLVDRAPGRYRPDFRGGHEDLLRFLKNLS